MLMVAFGKSGHLWTFIVDVGFGCGKIVNILQILMVGVLYFVSK